MTWTNAFDIGACTVEVYAAGDPSHPDYTGILSKGQSADLTLASTWTMHVAVSADGVVTLTNTSGSGLEIDAGVRIVPAYALTGMGGARATLPVSASGAGDATANGDLLNSFTNGDASVDLSSMTPYNQIAAQTNTIGSSSASIVVQFTPEFDVPAPVPVASDESITVMQGSASNVVPTEITVDGAVTVPDSLAIDSDPVHGSVAVNGLAVTYTPDAGYYGSDSFTYFGTVAGVDSNAATVSVTIQQKINCDCDDDHPTETLANLRKYLLVRLGFAAMLASPPPGMTDLLDSFLIEAQTLLYQRFRMLRLERWFTWDMVAGVRFYDLPANADACTKKLDVTRVRWVGISQGDDTWRPLVCGIEPTRYTSNLQGIPDSYEIRQCIEVFPAPSDDTWKLRIKGDFGLLPFAADTDTTTIDPQAIKLHALAYAKAHYGQSDAANHMSALTTFLGDLTASTHLTRRYIPGEAVAPPAVRPKVAN